MHIKINLAKLINEFKITLFMKMWRCSVCNFIYEGDEPPENCPRCNAPKDKFAELSDEQVKLIERSRFTNQLHAKLLVLLDEIREIAEEGIKDNLDPLCIKIFKEVNNFSKLEIQKIKAELEVHVKKGKWG